MTGKISAKERDAIIAALGPHADRQKREAVARQFGRSVHTVNGLHWLARA